MVQMADRPRSDTNCLPQVIRPVSAACAGEMAMLKTLMMEMKRRKKMRGLGGMGEEKNQQCDLNGYM